MEQTNDSQTSSTGIPSDLFLVAMQTMPLWESLSAVAGFDLPAASQERFSGVHRHLTTIPPPETLRRLVPPGDGRPDWLGRLTTKILDNVQEGVGACHYHLQAIRAIESDLHSRALAELARLNLPTTSNFGVGGGNTRRLNYEYQAFLLATRRTLEYFAGSVAAFFKSDDPGLRGLANSIARSEPVAERVRVIEKLDRNSALVESLLSQHPRITVRDRVAHWEPVQAGTFNLVCIPGSDPPLHLGLMGGGEELFALVPFDTDERTGLSDELAEVLERIEVLIFESYQALGLGDSIDGLESAGR